MENRPLQRIKAILELAVDVLKKSPNMETFIYSQESRKYNSFPDNPLFKDHHGLMIAFNKIDKETRGRVTIEYNPGRSLRAGDIDCLNSGPGGYIFHVDDQIELKRYLAEVEKQINSARPQFVLKVSSPRSLLYVQSKPNLCFKIEKDSMQFKLLSFLAEQREAVATSRLATKLNMTSRQITKTVDDLRSKLVNETGLSREYLFENDSNAGTGYKVDNVTIINGQEGMIL